MPLVSPRTHHAFFPRADTSVLHRAASHCRHAVGSSPSCSSIAPQTPDGQMCDSIPIVQSRLCHLRSRKSGWITNISTDIPFHPSADKIPGASPCLGTGTRDSLTWLCHEAKPCASWRLRILRSKRKVGIAPRFVQRHGAAAALWPGTSLTGNLGQRPHWAAKGSFRLRLELVRVQFI